jgi:hypothetical protein
MNKERNRDYDMKHTSKEREQLQKKAQVRFRDGQMLKDLKENQIFKFDLSRDYYRVATYPDRFIEHSMSKFKVRLGSKS